MKVTLQSYLLSNKWGCLKMMFRAAFVLMEDNAENKPLFWSWSVTQKPPSFPLTDHFPTTAPRALPAGQTEEQAPRVTKPRA